MSEEAAGGPVSVRDRRDPESSDVLDTTSLKKGRYYRWVHDRPTNIAKKRSRGMQFVKKGDVKLLFDQEDDRADGLVWVSSW